MNYREDTPSNGGYVTETHETSYVGLFVVACVVVGFVAALYFGAVITDNLAEIKQADGVIAVQQTIQQKDYYAYMAALVVMSQQAQQAADAMPDWFLPLLLLALGGDVLLGWKYFTRARG